MKVVGRDVSEISDDEEIRDLQKEVWKQRDSRGLLPIRLAQVIRVQKTKVSGQLPDPTPFLKLTAHPRLGEGQFVLWQVADGLATSEVNIDAGPEVAIVGCTSTAIDAIDAARTGDGVVAVAAVDRVIL